MGPLRNLIHRFVPVMLIALLFGVLAPQGFMPHFGPDGLTIELCSGVGNKAASISRDDPRYRDYLVLQAARSGKSAEDHHGEGDNPLPPCAFAGIAALAVPADPPDLPIIIAIDDIAPALHHTLLRARHHAGTPPATGPPALT